MTLDARASRNDFGAAPLSSSEAQPEVATATEAGVAAMPAHARAVQTWFGPSERPLYGWYHPPAEGVARASGVVLCSPFGYEMMCSHRAYRHLAEQLAAAGHPVLRFDYDGTGDSAGTPEDADRVPSWMASIDAAIAELRERSGAREVCLFGARLGALLAAAYAAKNPVDALVLFAPAVSGKAYLRELRALQMLKGAGPTPANARGHDAKRELEAVVGYSLDAETRADLQKLELLKSTARLAPRVLVIARDDIANNEDRLVAHLEGIGVQATLSTTAGYATMMADDPYKSVVPTAVWDEIRGWLSQGDGASGTSEAAPPPRPSRREATMTSGGAKVREELVEIGGMAGVLAEPMTLHPERSRTAVLLLNVGANHHVGSNRLYVTMARKWAHDGFRVLRFDLSGIGDSPAAKGRKENDIYAMASVAEAQAAMTFLEGCGCDRFVLGGICSGAYVAFHTGVADARVRGVVLINILAFHWKQGDSLAIRQRKTFKSTRYYSRAMFEKETWKRAFGGNVHVRAVLKVLGKRLLVRAKASVTNAMIRLRGPSADPSDVARGFRALSARGVDCLVVYGADEGGIDLMEEHLGVGAKKMTGAPGFELEIIDGPDHTFTPLWSQAYLCDMLTEHLLACFG